MSIERLNKRLAYSKNKKPRDLLVKSCHEVVWGTEDNRMTVYNFVFPDGEEGTLEGFYRGPGAFGPYEKYYTDRIGVYTSEGIYYNIEVDLRKKNVSKEVTYKIAGKEFKHSLLRCMTMGCKVNPENGWLLPNEENSNG